MGIVKTKWLKCITFIVGHSDCPTVQLSLK